jgi:hypothetical protein
MQHKMNQLMRVSKTLGFTEFAFPLELTYGPAYDGYWIDRVGRLFSTKRGEVTPLIAKCTAFVKGNSYGLIIRGKNKSVSGTELLHELRSSPEWPVLLEQWGNM